jgi:SAM-dependent methyltransferase
MRDGRADVVDRLFADDELAALYDLFSPWERRDDLHFYMDLVMAAGSVLDVGCGTGALLHGAREAGHTGRLCGLDPAAGMLQQARRRPDVEWVLGDLTSVRWDREFDLIVMSGHAFQVLLEDEALRASLAAVRAALGDDGRFAFETRNPLVRAWEQWSPAHAAKVVTAAGAPVRLTRQVEAVEGDRVSFAHTFSSPGWDRPRMSRSTLRFLAADALAAFLSEAGLAIERQYGDWDASPLTAASPEIITIARRA